ncbi:MAG: efflux RND transporter periplasmic adaptor subunit [Myxococcota bacterium]|jgi:membrane fusion protein (multidrug efflux system)|nr:efflux RND transporter periplasmic adaptor subunit [Myxococcota bacterium]
MTPASHFFRESGPGLEVLAILAIPLIILGCGKDPQEAAPSKRVPQVGASTVAQEDVDITRSYLVSLLPAEQTNILARTSGYVLSWRVDRGDLVHKGDRLALIERGELSDQQRQSTAQLEAARASMENAQESATRSQQLLQRKFISKSEAEAAQTAVRVTQAQLVAAEAAVGLSRTRIGYADITAPFSGTILKRGVDVGTLVSPQGPSLFVLGALDRIKAIASVPQADVPSLVVGMPVSLAVEGFSERHFTGEISRLAPSLDPATRTLEVEMIFPNPEELLRPGMFGRAQIAIERLTGTILVPPLAVARRGSSASVFVVKQGMAHRVEVKLGRLLADGRIEVREGLAPGDVIVTAGRDLVRDGGPVSATGAPGKAPAPAMKSEAQK